MHAAQHHQARVVGITISREQAARAEERVAHRRARRPGRHPAPGLSGARRRGVRRHRVGRHVRARRLRADAAVLRGAPRPPRRTGRLLNHAISSVGGSRMGGRSFVHRYVFPDGELHRRRRGRARHGASRLRGARRRVAPRALHRSTLRSWVANLEAGWDRAVELVGREPSPRVAALHGGVGARLRGRRASTSTRSSGIVPQPDGASGMPTTRDGWSTTGLRPSRVNMMRCRSSPTPTRCLNTMAA